MNYRPQTDKVPTKTVLLSIFISIVAAAAFVFFACWLGGINIFATSEAPGPKYLYGDYVAVKGFYARCRSTVVGFSAPHQYRLFMACYDQEGHFHDHEELWIYDSEIEGRIK